MANVTPPSLVTAASMKMVWTMKTGNRKQPTYNDLLLVVSTKRDFPRQGRLTLRSSGKEHRMEHYSFGCTIPTQLLLFFDQNRRIWFHGRLTIPSDHPKIDLILAYIMKHWCPSTYRSLPTSEEEKAAVLVVRENILEAFDISKDLINDEFILSYITDANTETEGMAFPSASASAKTTEGTVVPSASKKTTVVAKKASVDDGTPDVHARLRQLEARMNTFEAELAKAKNRYSETAGAPDVQARLHQLEARMDTVEAELAKTKNQW